MPQHDPDMTSLDTETLERMEREGREGLRARVRVLNDIHTLLDSAMLQMRQYAEIDSRVRATSSSSPSYQAASTSGVRSTSTPAKSGGEKENATPTKSEAAKSGKEATDLDQLNSGTSKTVVGNSIATTTTTTTTNPASMVCCTSKQCTDNTQRSKDNVTIPKDGG